MSRIARLIAAGVLGGRTYASKITNLFGSSIVSYLPLSEGAGSVAADIGGRGNNGAYTAVTLAQPGIGDGRTAGLFVPASSSRVDWYSAGLAAAFNSAAGTLAIWFKARAASVWTDAAIRYLVLCRADVSNVVYLIKSSVDNTVTAAYVAGGTSKGVTSTALGGNTDWNHLAVVWDTGSDFVNLYVNGVAGTPNTALGTWAGALGATTTNIGCLTAGNSVTDGTLAHGLLLNRAATAAEIAAAYAIP